MRAVLAMERWECLEYTASVDTGAAELFLVYPGTMRVNSNTLTDKLEAVGLTSVTVQTFGNDGNRLAGASIQRIRMLAARDQHEYALHGAHDGALERKVKQLQDDDAKAAARELDEKTQKAQQKSLQDIEVIKAKVIVCPSKDDMDKKFETVYNGFAAVEGNNERILQVLETSTAKIDDEVYSIAVKCADTHGVITDVAGAIRVLQLQERTVDALNKTIKAQTDANNRLRNEKGLGTRTINLLEARINMMEADFAQDKADLTAEKDAAVVKQNELAIENEALVAKNMALTAEKDEIMKEFIEQARESRETIKLLKSAAWAQECLQAHKRARPNDDAQTP